MSMHIAAGYRSNAAVGPGMLLVKASLLCETFALLCQTCSPLSQPSCFFCITEEAQMLKSQHKVSPQAHCAVQRVCDKKNAEKGSTLRGCRCTHSECVEAAQQQEAWLDAHPQDAAAHRSQVCTAAGDPDQVLMAVIPVAQLQRVVALPVTAVKEQVIGTLRHVLLWMQLSLHLLKTIYIVPFS